LPSPALLKRKIIIKNKKNLGDRRTQHKEYLDRSTNRQDSSSSLSNKLQLLEISSASEDPDLIEFGSESDDEDEPSPVSNYLSPEEILFRKKTIKDKGTAGKETKAGAEISALVNYVQPVHFHSFERAERE